MVGSRRGPVVARISAVAVIQASLAVAP